MSRGEDNKKEVGEGSVVMYSSAGEQAGGMFYLDKNGDLVVDIEDSEDDGWTESVTLEFFDSDGLVWKHELSGDAWRALENNGLVDRALVDSIVKKRFSTEVLNWADHFEGVMTASDLITCNRDDFSFAWEFKVEKTDRTLRVCRGLDPYGDEIIVYGFDAFEPSDSWFKTVNAVEGARDKNGRGTVNVGIQEAKVLSAAALFARTFNTFHEMDYERVLNDIGAREPQLFETTFDAVKAYLTASDLDRLFDKSREFLSVIESLVLRRNAGKSKRYVQVKNESLGL